jgi:Flp pilus assembly protein TadG
MVRSFSRAGTKLRLRRVGADAEALWTCRRGVAAIEFAFFGGLLAFAALNVVDISRYIIQQMQVANAAQMGAQAAWKTCGLPQLPATINCSGLAAAVTNAVQSTSLGTSITLQPGSPSEGYYCVNAANALQYISDVNSKPADCSAAGMPNLQPGDYISVQTTFAYAPLFSGITVAGKFPTPVVKTAMMRLG